MVVVTDEEFCTEGGGPYIVREPVALVITTDYLSYSDCKGKITVRAKGGTGDLTYILRIIEEGVLTAVDTIPNLPSGAEEEFTNLAAGTYRLLVQDANGCSVEGKDHIVEEQPIVVIDEDSFTDITCHNANDGTITVVASGGTGNTLTYTLSTGESNTNGYFTDLEEGTYYVTVSDASNCTAVSGPYVMTNPDGFEIITDTLIPISCNNIEAGATIKFEVSGGIPPLTYFITGGGSNSTGVFDSLGVGSYQVTVVDDNLCEVTGSLYDVVEPAPMIINLIDSLYSCGSLPIIEADTTFLPDGDGETYTSTIHHDDFADGAIVLSTADIESININIEHSFVADLTIQLICPNGSSLLFTDQHGGDKFLGEPVRSLINEDSIPGNGYVYTFTDDAEYTWANVPMAKYTYWDNDSNYHVNQPHIPSGSYRPIGDFSSLIGCPLNGDWTLEVTDNYYYDNGYLFKWNLNFAPSTFPVGYCNGMAEVEVPGVTGELTYLWSNGSTSPKIENLCADTYTVTVTDENGCKAVRDVVIKDVDIQLTITDTTHVICASDTVGSVTVENWSAPPYIYVWDNGTIGQTNENLSTGWHFLTITDRNTCEHYDSIEIKAIYDIKLEFTDTVPIMCNTGNGGSNEGGSATVDATGGSGNYTYLWSNGETGETAYNLVFGNNFVTVTDIVVGCTAVDTIYIDQPPLLEIISVNADDALCNGSSDGSIEISIGGGSGEYIVAWYSSDNELVKTEASTGLASLEGYPAGDYTVKIEDTNGCIIIPDPVITIGEPDSIKFNVVHTPTICSAATGTATVTDLTGGNGGETITWYNSVGDSIGTGATIGTLAFGVFL